MAIILSNLNRFTNAFHWKISGQIKSKLVMKIPPFVAHVAALPSETLMTENKRLTINYRVV